LAVCGLLLVAAGCGGGGGGGLPDGGNGGASGTSIRGRVVDRASSQPIENATVTVGGASTRTAEDGSFSLATPSGIISISASAANFHSGTFSAVVEPNQQENVGDLGLANVDSGPPPPPL
jgi:hypothetical protein